MCSRSENKKSDQLWPKTITAKKLSQAKNTKKQKMESWEPKTILIFEAQETNFKDHVNCHFKFP
jgi:hypothetical protein